jgi:hypothetical protein
MSSFLPCITALCLAITHVVRVSAEEEMIGVNTKPIVAAVADTDAMPTIPRWNRPVMYLPRHAMSSDWAFPSARGKLAVPLMR